MKNYNLFKTLLLLSMVFFLHQNISAQKSNTKFTKVTELEGIEEYLYTPNGLKILLVQDNSAPVVTVQMVYNVGSKHEVSGNTGSTHLLEHLMFKGTKKYNKKNGNSIDSELTRIGAQMNATTWNDRTNYYETIPSDKIELAIDIEADRMRNLLLLKEDKEAEMTVVRNEFERGENNPNSLLSKEIWATAYLSHGYHHSTIGWRSDIENMPMEVLRDFYDTYYWPNNAWLTVVGDFEKESLLKLVDKYFGKIERSEHEIPVPYTEESPQYGPRKVVVKRPGETSVVTVAYKIPGNSHEDVPALVVLASALGNGPSSTLYKNFVDSGEAFYAYASASQFAENGLLSVNIGFDPTKSSEAMNDSLLKSIEDIKENGVAQKDIDRIVANMNSQTILSRDGSGSIASDLTEYIASGDWKDYFNESKKLSKVTAKDVKHVANKYLVKDQSTTGYFIPKTTGSNDVTADSSSNWIPKKDGKYYYRTPNSLEASAESINEKAAKSTNMLTTNEEDFIRKSVAGIDVITMKTGAKDFVTIAASLPIRSYFDGNGNEMIPRLTTALLSKGTKKQDKFAFSQKLENLGVNISISSDNNNITIYFKSLSKDVQTVIDLLAEELRTPLLNSRELDLIKQQFISNLQQGLSDPGAQGSIALTQAIYSEGHPNYADDIQKRIEDIKSAKLEDIKSFHKKYFGPTGMHFVAVGDVNTKDLYKALKSSFKNWEGGVKKTTKNFETEKAEGQTKVITIPEKPSAELFIGQYTGLKRSHADFLPFLVGNHVLGGGFSGRLMLTVRDEAGLTYGIYTSHTGHTYTPGHWLINATFAPDLFDQGRKATMEQLEKWRNEGITQAELNDRKSNLIGSFKIGLATTNGLISNILAAVQRGDEPNYIYEYPKKIEAVTLEEVNASIKKYIDLEKLIVIKAGSLDQDGKPLK